MKTLIGAIGDFGLKGNERKHAKFGENVATSDHSSVAMRLLQSWP
jgi:hypothetical protein